MRFVTKEGARVTRFMSRDDDDEDDDDVTASAGLNHLKPKVKVKLNSSTPGETIQQINVLLCSLSCGMTLGLFCINSPYFHILHIFQRCQRSAPVQRIQ